MFFFQFADYSRHDKNVSIFKNKFRYLIKSVADYSRVSLSTDDFTMGYTHQIGFRAGTCTPFYFYDINLEVKQPIRIHPFSVCDYAFLKHKKQEQVFVEVDAVFREIKEVNGEFNIVFSNELLGSSNSLQWLELYKAILKRYYV